MKLKTTVTHTGMTGFNTVGVLQSAPIAALTPYLHSETKKARGGCLRLVLVGMTGFEPATPTSL
ncbi:MAG: hypothetical protein WBG62_06520, partial [Cyclobacteriaceae bacterium]